MRLSSTPSRRPTLFLLFWSAVLTLVLCGSAEWGRESFFAAAESDDDLESLHPPRKKTPDPFNDEAGVRVPDGFEVTLFADDDLAHDIFCLTVDSLGRVVVSGPGYVRVLIDGDDDGRADSFRQFADGPKSGLQGMHFLGRDLIGVGGPGLVRYRDRDGDDRADGPPDVFLKIKTGGEHHAHAVRKGPDGWWYLIAGNMAGVDEKYATLSTSPIREPQAGTLLRLRPDLSGGEILADGFRNAYDFDFNPQGDIFAYDSDGERDVSLPWYRPTRVFHVLPASHAGWISRSWKRPGYFLDMPPVVASFGRGSPTGVECYRHTQFPESYRGAVFVCDWTFGRVMALPLERSGSTYRSRPVTFMTGVGQFGFAPTDLAVGPDGSLYVSVGGRGTRGGVFRVRYTGNRARREWAPPGGSSDPAEAPTAGLPERGGRARRAGIAHQNGKTGVGGRRPLDLLAHCLAAPQPLSSWSRERWIPAARTLGRDAFVEAAVDGGRSAAERIRAVEILTELFDGLDDETARRLAAAQRPAVRARAAWSIGRTRTARPDARLLEPFLTDGDPLVRRTALETLLGAASARRGSPHHAESPTAGLPERAGRPAVDQRAGSGDPRTARELSKQLVCRLGDDDRFVRQTAIFVARRLFRDPLRELAQAVKPGDVQARLSLAAAAVLRESSVAFAALQRATAVLKSSRPARLKLEAARLLQLALGDVGPRDGREPVFDGYAPRFDLARAERRLDPLRIALAEAYPTGERLLDMELSRAIAMIQPYNATLLERILAQITDASHPVEDIHQLIVAARIPVPRDSARTAQTAQALVALEYKFARRDLNRDSNWEPRVGEMYAALVRHDPALPLAVVRQREFGLPGHVVFLPGLPDEHAQVAVDRFAARIRAAAEYEWTPDVVFVLARSKNPAHHELIRGQYSNFAVREAVVLALARNPQEQDRDKFVRGLDSAQLEVLTACISAVESLPAAGEGAEQVALVKTLRRLGRDRAEFPLRERIVRLLRRNTGSEFGFVLGKEGYRPQPEAVGRWTDWVSRRWPEEAAQQFGTGAADLDELRSLLAQTDWSEGRPERGRQLFEKRACSRCHGGRTALGPDLAGAASRFSREDLFIAIALPDRDVSPRYQTTLIQTAQGQVYTGLVIYESVDGVTLRDANNRTYRIEAADIEARRKVNSSLMPAGLLKDLAPGDLADLYVYLRQLGK